MADISNYIYPIPPETHLFIIAWEAFSVKKEYIAYGTKIAGILLLEREPPIRKGDQNHAGNEIALSGSSGREG